MPQLYLTQAPGEKRMRLLGFERVELAPGESREVTLTAEPRLLARFHAERPEVKIVLHNLTKTEQIEALRERRISVGFNRLVPREEANERGWFPRDDPRYIAQQQEASVRGGSLVFVNDSDQALYLLPEATINVEFYEQDPVGIHLPLTVDLKVTDTVPGIKGATAAAQTKAATLETGLVVQVPPFISEGEKIRVSTSEQAYLERA